MDEMRWTYHRRHRDQNPIQWGQIAVSALATLVVTVLAGVAIFYFTRQNTPLPSVYYETISSSAFSTDEVKTSIYSFRVWNEGNIEAEETQVSIKFPDDANIVEQKFDTSAGATIKVSLRNIDTHTLLATIPFLNPGESVTFSFLLSDILDNSVEVNVRGKGFVGQDRSEVKLSENTTSRNNVSSGEIILVTVLVIIQLSLLVYITKFARVRLFRMRTIHGETDFNNYAFRLLHMGKIEEAKKYLKLSIDKQPGPYALGNLAHALALESNFSEAIDTYHIARDYYANKDVNAFLDYCGFCIYWLNGNKEKALQLLTTALEKDSKEITGYIKRNKHIEEWKGDKDLLQVIEGAT